MATALEQSRERYARLRAPDWVPAPLVAPREPQTHAMIEHAASALMAYYLAGSAVRIGLADRTEHAGWIESLYTVRDPDPSGQGTTGAALLVPPTGDGVAFDLAYVRSVSECAELADRV